MYVNTYSFILLRILYYTLEYERDYLPMFIFSLICEFPKQNDDTQQKNSE